MATVSPWIDRSTASDPNKPKFQNQEVLRRRYKWWTFLISSLNLLAIAALVMVCLYLSENWWLSGALIYLPQTPLVIPSVLLLGCSLMWHLRSALLNLTSIGADTGLSLRRSFFDEAHSTKSPTLAAMFD